MRAARERIREYVYETNCPHSSALTGLSGCEAVWLKLENRQKTRAFKARGALKYASLSSTTNSDLQYVRFHEGQSLVVYLLWAGKEPTAVPGLDVARSFKFGAAEVQRVVDAVAPSCFAQRRLRRWSGSACSTPQN